MLQSDMSQQTNRHEGWIWKWTNYVNGYQRRWFVLGNGMLSYYKCPEEISAGCRGSVSLKTAFIGEENETDFRVEIGSFVYYLRAAGEKDSKKWVEALKEAKIIEGKSPRSVWLDHRTQEDNVKAIIAPIEAKLDELKSCGNKTDDHGSALSTSLADFAKAMGSLLTSASESGDELRIEKVIELIAQFRTTSTEILASGTEFIDLAKHQAVIWRNTLELERNLYIANEVDELSPGLAGGTSSDDEEFQDAADMPLRFANGQVVRENKTVDAPVNTEHIRSNNSIIQSGEHRTSIPFKPDYRLNLWAALKYCVGRDLSKLPVPVNFNEPLSILQRLAEELEYSELLDKAACCTDSCEQMAYVAAFSVSSYSTNANRTGKPFNPMLGETFELDCTDELGFRFIAEQVSHHPPQAAVHVESAKNRGHGGWSYWQDATPLSKFWGNFLTLTPIGTCHLLFHSSGNHYTWTKATITVNNIILGKLWFDESGESKFINHTTGDKCKIQFYQYNYLDSKSYRKVSGTVTDKADIERYRLHGYWDKSLKWCEIKNSAPDAVIWEANPLPPQAEKMYHFTRFAMILNGWIEGTPPTDSRRRPDQRKMEEADWDEANQIKLELEERQRARRREKERRDDERKKQGLQPEPYQPLWFRREQCPVTGEFSYVYANEYWESKEQQDWTRCTNIFDMSGDKFTGSAKENWPDIVKSVRIIGPEVPKTHLKSN